MDTNPHECSRKRPSRYTKRYLHRHLGCWRGTIRNVASARAHQLEAQRRRRLRWHMDQVAQLQDEGPYRLVIEHARAGEAIARNLGDLESALGCMLSRGRAYWCVGWDLDSIVVMESAILMLDQRRVKPTRAMYDTAVALCYRLANTLSKRGFFPKADTFISKSEELLKAYQHAGGDTQSVNRHRANIFWIWAVRNYLNGRLQEAFDRITQADTLYRDLPSGQNSARIKYEIADIELARAAKFLECGEPQNAEPSLAHADQLLDECATLLADHDWQVVRAMLIILRRRLAVMRGSGSPEHIAELLAVADMAQEKNDPVVRSFALVQACRELVASGKREEAAAMLALASSVTDIVPDTLREHRAIVHRELVQLAI